MECLEEILRNIFEGLGTGSITVEFINPEIYRTEAVTVSQYNCDRYQELVDFFANPKDFEFVISGQFSKNSPHYQLTNREKLTIIIQNNQLILNGSRENDKVIRCKKPIEPILHSIVFHN